MLTEVQTYTNVAPQARLHLAVLTHEFNSFAFTSGATFDEFAKGPGNVNLLVQSLTTQNVTGGGGNIRTKIVTTREPSRPSLINFRWSGHAGRQCL